ncbi:murein biosynthesis integral membrane protein MurJ [Streptomyces sp. NPDC048718]|uniref:murein biosynthesis integral membrane protein MurJ n=1 Tax=Streptomyces sp. NPDC048718 TaxID=3365587 RepID=UPI00371F645B
MPFTPGDPGGPRTDPWRPDAPTDAEVARPVPAGQRPRVPGPGARKADGARQANGPRTAGTRTSRRGGGARGPSGTFLMRAAFVTAVLTAVGAVLGLVRDQILARYFGAGAETDAFLVAWTVPEFASTLLIEDAMALILVPAFAGALARRSMSAPGATPGLAPYPDPVRALVRHTMPRLVLTVAAVAALLVVGAPQLVDVLAPGLPDPALAVDCTRLTATCVLSFALAGYCSAALRAHGSFLPPAAIYVAYNVGIIGTTLALREPFGVRAAAAGVAVGAVLMVAIQAPSLVRELRDRRSNPKPARPGPDGPVGGPAGGAAGGPAGGADARPADRSPGEDGRLLVLGMIAPVVVFALTRQSQVLIERFLASPLPAGAISHLNYAQKVAQMPMTVSLILCTVSFPVVARTLASGDPEAARRRVERDLLLAAVVVLIGASTVIAAAPQIVDVLFQRGAFDAADTAATAGVMRVYALGLLGQTLVGALVRCYFSAARPLWYPAAAMGYGLSATAVTGAVGAHLWGAAGIAGANALGITVTAVLLLSGARRQAVPIDVPRLGEGLLRLATAGAWATGAGWLCARLVDPPLLAVAVAGLVVTGVFLLFVACAATAPDIPPLPRARARSGDRSRTRAETRGASRGAPVPRTARVTRLARISPRRTPHARARRAAPPTAANAPVDRDVPLRRRPFR